MATVDRPAGTLALSLANLHPAEPLECVIWVPGRTMAGPGRLSTLNGASPEAFNDISHPDDVSISRTSVAATDDSCRVLLRPHSVNILRLETADAER